MSHELSWCELDPKSEEYQRGMMTIQQFAKHPKVDRSSPEAQLASMVKVVQDVTDRLTQHTR